MPNKSVSNILTLVKFHTFQITKEAGTAFLFIKKFLYHFLFVKFLAIRVQKQISRAYFFKTGFLNQF